MTGMMKSPPATARAPPGQKSFWTSTTRRAVSEPKHSWLMMTGPRSGCAAGRTAHADVIGVRVGKTLVLAVQQGEPLGTPCRGLEKAGKRVHEFAVPDDLLADILTLQPCHLGLLVVEVRVHQDGRFLVAPRQTHAVEQPETVPGVIVPVQFLLARDVDLGRVFGDLDDRPSFELDHLVDLSL